MSLLLPIPGHDGSLGSFEYLVYENVLRSLGEAAGLQPVFDYGDEQLERMLDPVSSMETNYSSWQTDGMLCIRCSLLPDIMLGQSAALHNRQTSGSCSSTSCRTSTALIRPWSRRLRSSPRSASASWMPRQPRTATVSRASLRPATSLPQVRLLAQPCEMASEDHRQSTTAA